MTKQHREGLLVQSMHQEGEAALRRLQEHDFGLQENDCRPFFDLGGALATRCKNPAGRSLLKVMRGASCRGVSRVCTEMLEVFRSDLLLHLSGSSKRMAGGIRVH